MPKKIKDAGYLINLHKFADVETHWITLFCKKSKIVFFDSFDV